MIAFSTLCYHITTSMIKSKKQIVSFIRLSAAILHLRNYWAFWVLLLATPTTHKHSIYCTNHLCSWLLSFISYYIVWEDSCNWKQKSSSFDTNHRYKILLWEISKAILHIFFWTQNSQMSVRMDFPTDIYREEQRICDAEKELQENILLKHCHSLGLSVGNKAGIESYLHT